MNHAAKKENTTVSPLECSVTYHNVSPDKARLIEFLVKRLGEEDVQHYQDNLEQTFEMIEQGTINPNRLALTLVMWDALLDPDLENEFIIYLSKHYFNEDISHLTKSIKHLVEVDMGKAELDYSLLEA